MTAERPAKRPALTLRTRSRRWPSGGTRSRRRGSRQADRAGQRSAAQSRRYLDKDLIPALGKQPIAEITRADVLATVRRVEKRGALNVAEKIRTWLNQIFRFAIAEGLLEMNPAANLDIVAAVQPPVKHNPILRQNQLGQFLADLAAFDGSEVTRIAIRLLLLTGVRTGELRAATPD